MVDESDDLRNDFNKMIGKAVPAARNIGQQEPEYEEEEEDRCDDCKNLADNCTCCSDCDLPPATCTCAVFKVMRDKFTDFLYQRLDWKVFKSVYGEVPEIAKQRAIAERMFDQWRESMNDFAGDVEFSD